MKTSPRSGGFFQLFWQVYGENIRFLAFPGYLGKMVQPWENSRSIGISDKPGMVGGATWGLFTGWRQRGMVSSRWTPGRRIWYTWPADINDPTRKMLKKTEENPQNRRRRGTVRGGFTCWNSKNVKISLQVHWMFVDPQKEDVSFHLILSVSPSSNSLHPFPTVPLEFLLNIFKTALPGSDEQRWSERDRREPEKTWDGEGYFCSSHRFIVGFNQVTRFLLQVTRMEHLRQEDICNCIPPILVDRHEIFQVDETQKVLEVLGWYTQFV